MGVGQTERGLGAIGRRRSCGEVGGTGAEVVFPWSVRSPVSSPLSFISSFISSSFPFHFHFHFHFHFLFSLMFNLTFQTTGPDSRKHPLEGAVKTEIKRQQRRTSQHRKRRNRGDENTIWAWSPKNVNSRAIAFRLHAQMNYSLPLL